MNKVSSQWIKAIFMLGVIGFMGYMTYSAVMIATGNRLTAFLSIFLFDGGAYSGYQMYVGNAEGAHQRHAARVILWIDFILAAFMVAGGLTLLPPHSILFVMLASAAFNGGVLYYYETHDPETLEQAQEQDERDALALAATKNRKKLHKEAMRQADNNIMRQASALGALLSLRATAQLKYDMRLPMTETELKAWNEDVIEAEEIPAAALPAPAAQPSRAWDFLSRFFGRGQRTMQHATPSQQDAPQPSPKEAPQDNPQPQEAPKG